MKNKLTKEEQLFNDKLESAEFDFQDSHWAEMQEMIGKKGFFSSYSTLIKAAAAIITVSSLIYWLNTENNNAIQKVDQPIAEQNIQESEVSQQTENLNPSNISTTSNMKKDITVEENASSMAQPIEDVSSTWLDESATGKTQEESNNKVDPELEEEISTINQKEESSTEQISNLNPLKIIGKYCLGETVLLEANVPVDWFINGKKKLTSSTEFKVQLKNNNKLLIKAQLVSNGKVIDEEQTNIQAPIIPSVDFTYEDNKDVYYDFYAKLKATPSGLSNYKWMVDGKETALEGQHISYPFGKKGIYDVALIYESKEGCISKIEKPVAIEQDFKPFVNAFSPNGDGINDLFVPEMFEIVEGDFQMTIFDGNGNTLYKSNSISSPWNGRRNNTGELMPLGIYIWKVQIQNKEGIIKTFTDRFKMVEF